MSSKKTHNAAIEDESVKALKACDQLVHGIAKELVEAGIPLTLVLERMLTFCAAHTVSNGGVARAANTFRSIALEIEAGALMEIDPAKQGAKH